MRKQSVRIGIRSPAVRTNRLLMRKWQRDWEDSVISRMLARKVRVGPRQREFSDVVKEFISHRVISVEEAREMFH